MKIVLTSSLFTASGTVHERGETVDWADDADAQRMIRAGVARPAPMQFSQQQGHAGGKEKR